ncbi:MAG: tRNA pseudouridine(13) synthase TruD [Methanolobus sp.]
MDLGDLYGNSSGVAIRDIDMKPDELEKTLESTTKEILAFGGVPNFFGIQRFGAVRPVAHMIGEQLLKGDFENAAMIYIAKSFPDETEDVKRQGTLCGTQETLWKDSKNIRFA